MLPIWPGTNPTLVADQASVWWLDLVSPFGDCPEGVDWTIQLPDGLSVLPLEERPGMARAQTHIALRSSAIQAD